MDDHGLRTVGVLKGPENLDRIIIIINTVFIRRQYVVYVGKSLD